MMRNPWHPGADMVGTRGFLEWVRRSPLRCLVWRDGLEVGYQIGVYAGRAQLLGEQERAEYEHWRQYRALTRSPSYREVLRQRSIGHQVRWCYPPWAGGVSDAEAREHDRTCPGCAPAPDPTAARKLAELDERIACWAAEEPLPHPPSGAG